MAMTIQASNNPFFLNIYFYFVYMKVHTYKYVHAL